MDLQRLIPEEFFINTVRLTPKEEKEKAWVFYRNWKKRPSFSPAFKKVVRISGKGWKHLFQKGNHKRPWKDVSRRLRLLPYAKALLEKSTTIQALRYQKGEKYFSIEGLVETSSNDRQKLTKVCVILIEMKGGEIVFYSVMEKKISK